MGQGEYGGTALHLYYFRKNSAGEEPPLFHSRRIRIQKTGVVLRSFLAIHQIQNLLVGMVELGGLDHRIGKPWVDVIRVVVLGDIGVKGLDFRRRHEVRHSVAEAEIFADPRWNTDFRIFLVEGKSFSGMVDLMEKYRALDSDGGGGQIHQVAVPGGHDRQQGTHQQAEKPPAVGADIQGDGGIGIDPQDGVVGQG